jgi:type VI secretion system protein ImpK
MAETLRASQNLATCYENALTVILRLTTMDRQAVPDSQAFRANIRAALKSAMEQAKVLGYSSESNQLAFFAVVALLDESVLRLQSPALADWAQRPMQEEMFGHNRAGEVFFDNLATLFARQDSAEVADCLEVYCLAMQLGFRGKYALAPISTSFSQATQGPARPSAEIQALIRQVRQKIDRIRGALVFLPPLALAADAPRKEKRDAVGRWLGIAAMTCLGIAICAFVLFALLLGSGASQLG